MSITVVFLSFEAKNDNCCKRYEGKGIKIKQKQKLTTANRYYIYIYNLLLSTEISLEHFVNVIDIDLVCPKNFI